MESKDVIKSLEALELPVFVNFKEIKARYKELVKKEHPDIGGDRKRFEEIVFSYKVLEEYILNYRFDFSKDEIERQYPNESYAKKFRI